MTDTDDFEKMERDGWSDPVIAKGYADGFENAARLVAQKLADLVNAGPGTAVLELCTGPGDVAAELARRGATVTGLDFSAAMISLATKAVPGARFVQGDAMAMDFEDQCFDAVTIGFGVPHFPDTDRGLSEAARVLKPGGQLAFSIWYGKGSAGSFGWLFDAVGRLGDPSVSLPDGPDAHLLSNRDVAEEMVTKAGFSDVQFVDIPSEIWVPLPESLFDVFDKGAVRAASLLGGQPDHLRDAIRADLAARVVAEGQAKDGGYVVPAPSVAISAKRVTAA